MTAKKKSANNQEIVREYLSKHPDFFTENPDIFEAINISHESGKAISLVERQIGIMRERNGQMSTQIDQMQTMAKNLMEKTNRLVLNLIRAKDLSSLTLELNFTFWGGG